MGWVKDIISFFRGPQANNMTAVNQAFRDLAEDYKKKIQELEKERDEWKAKYDELKKKQRGMYE